MRSTSITLQIPPSRHLLQKFRSKRHTHSIQKGDGESTKTEKGRKEGLRFQPSTEPTAGLLKPAAEPTKDQATKPVTEPIIEPAIKHTIELDTELATEPATEPAAKPAESAKPLSGRARSSSESPSIVAAEAKPADHPVTKPADNSSDGEPLKAEFDGDVSGTNTTDGAGDDSEKHIDEGDENNGDASESEEDGGECLFSLAASVC